MPPEAEPAKRQVLNVSPRDFGHGPDAAALAELKGEARIVECAFGLSALAEAV